MACDCYVAISQPLHDAITMNRQKRHSILIASCAGGLLHSLGLFLLAIVWPFCGPGEIDHCFRDAYLLLKLACTDTHKIGFFVIANSGLMGTTGGKCFMVAFCRICAHIIQNQNVGGHQNRKEHQSSLFTLDMPQHYQKIKCLRSSTQLLSPCSTRLSTHLETWRWKIP